MKNDMPETMYLSKQFGGTVGFEEFPGANKYTHVENLKARIEAMKREPDEDNCRFQRHWDAEVLECQIHNAALSAVIDMLGQKEG